MNSHFQMNPSPIPILIPLLNPNENDARLVSLLVSEGQHVEKDHIICTLETTKSTADVTAEAEGYISGLRFEEGQTVRAGDILCYLAESPDWKVPEAAIPVEETGISPNEIIRPEGSQTGIPKGLRITQPALALATANDMDLQQLPIGPFVTEKMVREVLQASISQKDLPVPDSVFDPNAIIIYGGGGHGKTLIELVNSLGKYHLVGIVDDGLRNNEKVMNLLVLGGSEILPELHARGVRLAVNAVGGVGDIYIRIKVFQSLDQASFTCPSVVHPTAYVEPSAALSPGVQVLPFAYVGSDVDVGFGVIVNTGAIVSHGCSVGNYSHIAPGTILAGDVIIGEGTLIGMGVTINLGVKIGFGTRIGNGATIKSDVPDESIVRAGSIWPP